MSSELTEENQYSKFDFRNFGNIPASFEYMDLVQKLEYAIKPSAVLAYADIDQYPSAVTDFKLTQLPSVVVRSNPPVIDERILQITPTALFGMLPQVQEEFKVAYEKEKEIQFEKCRRLIEENPLILFIKGTPEAPKCKFTRQMLGELKPLNIKFSFYDIDNDQMMRHWLKLYSKWKTFPQIFVDGKILGGLDVLLEQIKNGTFLDSLPPQCKVLQ